MIPAQKFLPTIKSTNHRNVTPVDTDVPHYVHAILWVNELIMVLDNSFIMFFDRRERTD